MTRVAEARSLEELYGFSDADTPTFKRWLEGRREEGIRLYLPPSVAAAATAKGFEEGVHFDITRSIPDDVIKSSGDW